MDQIKFKVNGVEYYVGKEVSSHTTLLDYLRHELELRGTKYMCKGGRCGACIVAVSKGPGDPVRAVNSCLVSIPSCHNWNITTIEELGNSNSGYHSIQETLAKASGTQCGYCTPGWVMSLYSLLKGYPGKPTMHEIEKSFSSNICRCTGYRPILEAFKKYGKDAPIQSIMDMEDMKVCDKTGDTCCKSDNCHDSDWCVVTGKEVTRTPVINIPLKDRRDWYRVEEIREIFDVLQLKGDRSYMLVNGNTAKGVVSMDDLPETLIDISEVSALKGSKVDQNLIVGAGITITDMIELFDLISNKETFSYLKEFNHVLKFVANTSVRNIGTAGGNLMIANEYKSITDISLLLVTVGAQVVTQNSASVTETLSMPDFFKTDMRGKLLTKILLPPLGREYKLVAYKVAGKAENAGTILMGCFLYKLDLNFKVLDCTIAFSHNSPLTASNTERYLRQKQLFNNDTLQGAITTLQNEIILKDSPPATSAKYRKYLSIGLFYKSLLSICPPGILNSIYRSGGSQISRERPMSKARQTFDTDASLYPLNQPIAKVEGLIQCAGESPYTDDVPSFPHEVYAAFVLSTVPLGKIECVDASVALATPGVLAFYTAADIPGLNSFTSGVPPASTTNEEILCDGNVKYFNQPIGIIVAESQYLAEKATKLVTVKYSSVRKPVIDVKEVKNDQNRTSLFKHLPAKETGQNVTKVIKGDVTIRGQYHACMETLVCATKLTEEGIQIYTASQFMDSVQLMTSRALNIPQNKIDVYIRRVGGSYGYKISRATQVAIACSLVVKKLHRPCRFVQTLKTNMKAVGKRLPCHADFEIGVDNNGVIQYNNYELYEDNGYLVNEPLVAFTLDCYNNCYKNVRWNYKVFNTTTETASNTWCRSPGSLECIAMAELMMEQISYEMSLDPVQVRLANLDTDTYDPIRQMYEKLKIDCQYTERKAAVDKFNKENRWKKRGIRFAFMIWNPIELPIYLVFNISVLSGDGTVVITHGGIEMGQGINTKAVQICAYMLKIPVDKIQIKATDTTTSPNSFVSGASITSSNVGMGIQRCCKALLEKLEPIRAEMDNPTWVDLINKAFASGVDLQTHSFINLKDNVPYHVHGVACAEVEIDALTGESQIIRVDLAGDAGQSVSPYVDVGQMEGAFIMGVGYWTCEKLVYNSETGEVLTDSFNTYWPMQALDIPQEMNISLMKNSYSSDAILGSKATGEPATCLGVVVPISLRAAMVASRCESGIPATSWFKIDGPYTVESIYLGCATRVEDFKFY